MIVIIINVIRIVEYIRIKFDEVVELELIVEDGVNGITMTRGYDIDSVSC